METLFMSIVAATVAAYVGETYSDIRRSGAGRGLHIPDKLKHVLHISRRTAGGRK